MHRDLSPPRIAQLAFCTRNLPRSVRFYTEVFGFADAGGRVMWGERVGEIQKLGADAEFTLWWMVGRQEFFQLEFFHHTLPAQRPLPADARPSDHGWVRWGLAVPDFDATLQRLAGFGVRTVTEPATYDGLRRACFRDPETGVMVEVLEDGPTLPGGVRPRFYELAPAALYGAISVPDLDDARRLYVGALELEELPLEVLHAPEHEALWGLEGIHRDGFVVRAGDMYLEVVRYEGARPRSTGARLSDQGFMNAAIGYRARAGVEAAYERVSAHGFSPNRQLSAAGATYVTDAQGASLEILAVERELDGPMGFAPQPRFPPSAVWPRTKTSGIDV